MDAKTAAEVQRMLAEGKITEEHVAYLEEMLGPIPGGWRYTGGARHGKKTKWDKHSDSFKTDKMRREEEREFLYGNLPHTGMPFEPGDKVMVGGVEAKVVDATYQFIEGQVCVELDGRKRGMVHVDDIAWPGDTFDFNKKFTFNGKPL